MARNGVLIVAVGGPASVDEAVPYLTALHGRTPDEATAGTLRRALLTVGGSSPATGRSERVAAALERALNGIKPAEPLAEMVETLMPHGGMPSGRTDEPVDIAVQVGFMGTEPSIAEAGSRLAAAGVERMIVLPLSPYMAPDLESVARQAAGEVASVFGIEVRDAAEYGRSDDFLRVVAEYCQDAVEQVFPEHRPLIVFAAQESPLGPRDVADDEQTVALLAREIGMGDPDADGLEEVLGIRAFGGPGTAAPWLLAYSAEAEGKVGPGRLSVSEAIAAAQERGLGGAAVLPFTSTVDDVWILYDLDVLAADQLLMEDMEYARPGMLNEDPRYIAALAAAVRAAL